MGIRRQKAILDYVEDCKKNANLRGWNKLKSYGGKAIGGAAKSGYKFTAPAKKTAKPAAATQEKPASTVTVPPQATAQEKPASTTSVPQKDVNVTSSETKSFPSAGAVVLTEKQKTDLQMVRMNIQTLETQIAMYKQQEKELLIG